MNGEFRMLNIEKAKKGMNNTISPFLIHHSPYSMYRCLSRCI